MRLEAHKQVPWVLLVASVVPLAVLSEHKAPLHSAADRMLSVGRRKLRPPLAVPIPPSRKESVVSVQLLQALV